MVSERVPVRWLPDRTWAWQQPTWRQARPSLIQAALKRAQDRPSGNWFVLGGTREVRRDRPFGRTIAGVEVVAWRGSTVRCMPVRVRVHTWVPRCVMRRCGVGSWCVAGMGWPWGPVAGLGGSRSRPSTTGVLAWVRLDAVGGEAPLPRPVLPARPDPATSLDAVFTAIGRCEPEDVIANRLDPWHGSWFHPYSFVGLRVVEEPGDDPEVDRFVVEVAFRLTRRIGVPVRAAFSCPEPRTVVMRILEEGAGSVVETHAVPLGCDDVGHLQTAVIEATIASSPRPGFALARRGAPLIRPAMVWAAARLWRDDLAYAQRRYDLRTTGRWPG